MSLTYTNDGTFPFDDIFITTISLSGFVVGTTKSDDGAVRLLLPLIQDFLQLLRLLLPLLHQLPLKLLRCNTRHLSPFLLLSPAAAARPPVPVLHAPVAGCIASIPAASDAPAPAVICIAAAAVAAAAAAAAAGSGIDTAVEFVAAPVAVGIVAAPAVAAAV